MGSSLFALLDLDSRNKQMNSIYLLLVCEKKLYVFKIM